LNLASSAQRVYHHQLELQVVGAVLELGDRLRDLGRVLVALGQLDQLAGIHHLVLQLDPGVDRGAQALELLDGGLGGLPIVPEIRLRHPPLEGVALFQQAGQVKDSPGPDGRACGAVRGGWRVRTTCGA
jgi:hypothetical protein